MLGIRSFLGLARTPNKPLPIDKEELLARRAAFAKTLANKYEAPITPPPESVDSNGKIKRPRFILGSVQSEGQMRTVALVADHDSNGRVCIAVPCPLTLADIFDEAKVLGLDDVVIDVYGAFSESLREHFKGSTDRRLLDLTDLDIVSLLGPLATRNPQTNRERLLEVLGTIGNLTNHQKAEASLEMEARHRLYTERQSHHFQAGVLPPQVALACVERLARSCGDVTEGHEMYGTEERALPVRATLLALATAGQDAATMTEAAITLVKANDDWTLVEALLTEGAKPTRELVNAAMSARNAEEYLHPLLVANGSPVFQGDPVRRTVELGNWDAAADLLRVGAEAGGDLTNHPAFDMVKAKTPQSREVLDLFLSNSLNPNQVDPDGVSLLEHALASQSPLVSSLVWYGADLSKPLTTGKTGLQSMFAEGVSNKTIYVGGIVSAAEQDKRDTWAKRAGRPVMGAMIIDVPKRPKDYSNSLQSRKTSEVEL
jgi:hypothetical protein